ncbi:MAG: MATE family efflux transporter [Erysipelotrichaceae bacterium]|nr:MATE family efflux transporter [Erysipelotrichaceae bacterium]
MRKKLAVNILEGNLWKNVLLYSIPIMISNILQLLFNAVDMIVVGRFSGPLSMAAVSSTGSLVALVINLFVGLSVGTTVSIAKRIGSRDYDSVQKAVHTSIAVALIFGSFLTVVGIVFSKQFLLWMGSPENVIDKSTLYLRCYFSGMIATMTYNFAAATLRAKGDTRRPLIALVTAGILNATLNLFFVVVLKLDVAGVGLASSISSYVSAFIVLMTLIKDEGLVHLEIRHLYIDKDALKEIATVGLPAGIQSTFFNISNVLIQSSINSFGSIIMAGNGAASSISDFVSNVIVAFYQGCLTFTSQNVGAKQIKRVPKILLVCEVLAVFLGFVTGEAALLAGESLLSIYASDPEVIAAGMIKLRCVTQYYFLYAAMEVIVGSLRGMGASIFPMAVSLLGICVFRIFWIMTVFQSIHTIEILYYSYPISWIITGVIHLFTWFFIMNRTIRKQEADPE